jgi:hypothetical protein
MVTPPLQVSRPGLRIDPVWDTVCLAVEVLRNRPKAFHAA